MKSYNVEEKAAQQSDDQKKSGEDGVVCTKIESLEVEEEEMDTSDYVLMAPFKVLKKAKKFDAAGN